MKYGRCDEFLGVMRHTIAMNGSFFNSHRMAGRHRKTQMRSAAMRTALLPTCDIEAYG